MNLYPYQTKYLKDLPKNIIMAADVGLGKTIMALEHARRYGIIGKLVVVAPASKVRTGDWQREILKFFSAGQPVIKDGVQVAVRYDAFIPDYEVVSYEMFSKRAHEFASPQTTLIIDESHFIQSATAKRSKAILAVARLAHQWIMLSATPLPNGWKSGESYAILTGLAKNKTQFVNNYQVWDRSRGFPIFVAYKYEDQLQAWWSRIAKPLVRTGDLVLPSENIPVSPAMRPGLEREYKKAKRDRIYQDEELDNPSKLFHTLRQIPNPARVDALQSIVESTDEHIVVFYNYKSERDQVEAMLKKSFKGRKIYEQSGQKSELPKRDNWKRLKPSVTLVQYQSGSQAIELTYASVTVYLSPPTSFANYEQSKGRTRRNGQEKTTLFYHISIEGSLDAHIWRIIKSKRDFSLKIFEEMLGE